MHSTSRYRRAETPPTSLTGRGDGRGAGDVDGQVDGQVDAALDKVKWRLSTTEGAQR